MQYTLANGFDDRKSNDDPGNLHDRLDVEYQAILTVEHLAFDGQPHATPEALERLEADLLVAGWREGGR